MKKMKYLRTWLVVALVVTIIGSLTGGTVAWFTDSVTSANNVIEAGNLDVELDYMLPGGTWQPVNEDTVLFSEDVLWEPGHTEVVALRIKNAGTLALKYDLKVKVSDEKTSTNVYDNEFKLSDYLTVGHSAIQENGVVGELLMSILTGSREGAQGNVSGSTLTCGRRLGRGGTRGSRACPPHFQAVSGGLRKAGHCKHPF